MGAGLGWKARWLAPEPTLLPTMLGRPCSWRTCCLSLQAEHSMHVPNLTPGPLSRQEAAGRIQSLGVRPQSPPPSQQGHSLWTRACESVPQRSRR